MATKLTFRSSDRPVEPILIDTPDAGAVERVVTLPSLKKKVFVSGCFDLLHSGHVRFLEEAARLGEVHVGLGSDETVRKLKGRYPVKTQEERKYMLEALRHVKACYINRGSGIMDFLSELDSVVPDILVVNEDGATTTKAALCKERGIEYVVLQRTPRANLPARSTTSLRQECRIPYRLDLAGGWLDQPFVSKHAAGPLLTLAIEPAGRFNERSGMASSTRRRAVDLWQTDLPAGDREKTARMLFCYENPPGTRNFSGSQDAIGIVYPGLNRLDYHGDYWPKKITSVADGETLDWLEAHLQLVPLQPRKSSFNVLKKTHITPARARALAQAGDLCWQAILKRDLEGFGRQLRASFEAQISMFPQMSNRDVQAAIQRHTGQALGWKLSGAGGGGYLVLVSRTPVASAIRIQIRRGDF